MMNFMHVSQAMPQLAWITPQGSDGLHDWWHIELVSRSVQISAPRGQLPTLAEQGQMALVCLTDADFSSSPLQYRLFPDLVDWDIKAWHFQLAGPEQVQVLSDIWSCLLFIRSPALRAFYLAILSDQHLISALYQAKASQTYHHAYPGGLLDHSHEVAMTAAMLAWQHGLPQDEVAVAFVGGLLHDIGKIGMFYNQPSGAGSPVRHEDLNFLVLSSYLQSLQGAAPRIFEAICGCLQTNILRHSADYLAVDMVRMADRLSTEVANWKSVFAHHPAHHWFAKGTADQRIYKRLAS